MTGGGLAKFNQQLNKMSCPPCITKKFNDPSPPSHELKKIVPPLADVYMTHDQASDLHNLLKCAFNNNMPI
jgi:hypothetical protein